MIPRTRSRRASFLPRDERTSAFTVMSFLTSSPYQGRSSPNTCAWVAAWKFLYKQNTNRSLFVNRLNRRRQQFPDRQRSNPARPLGLLGKRNRIRENDFLQL